MTAAEILRLLVAIPTPSASSNLPLIHWVEEFLQNRGWRAQRFPYADENGIAKANLIAQPASAPDSGFGSDQPIGLAFVCHTDTVPFAESWHTALELLPSADAAFLHACGACDVKGALACFLAALNSCPPSAMRPDVALILTADEEIGCKGMECLLAATSLRIRSAIVSEPTSLHPGIAGKGYGLARVSIHGVEAHSAYPAEGLSAIALAVRFLHRMQARLQHLVTSAAPSPLFDPPHTTWNVGVLQGGSAKNIIAGACSFLVEWRPIPSDPPSAVLHELERLAEQLRSEEPRARIHIEPLRAEPGFEPSAQGPLRQRLAAIAADTGQPARLPTGISFGSEASRLARIADEVIVIGPGDMHTAHSSRERVPVAELEQWTRTLHTLLGAAAHIQSAGQQ